MPPRTIHTKSPIFALPVERSTQYAGARLPARSQRESGEAFGISAIVQPPRSAVVEKSIRPPRIFFAFGFAAIALWAGKPQVFLRTTANERPPTLSPDGRWLAYSSDA